MTKKNVMNDQSGSSMVEVLVGFTVLVILMEMMVHLIDFSSKMMIQAVDKINAQRHFQQELYKKTPEEMNVTNKNVVLILQEEADENAASMSLDAKLVVTEEKDDLEAPLGVVIREIIK